jgi:hypothetical protein
LRGKQADKKGLRSRRGDVFETRLEHVERPR